MSGSQRPAPPCTGVPSRRSSASKAPTSRGATIVRKRNRSARCARLARRPDACDRARIARRLCAGTTAARCGSTSARASSSCRRSAVRLIAGSLYFDSAAGSGDAGSSGADARRANAGRRSRAHRHAIHGDASKATEVVLSVREGQVNVTGDGFELVVDAQRGARLACRRRARHRAIDGLTTAGSGPRRSRRRPSSTAVRRSTSRVGRARDRAPCRLRVTSPRARARRILARHRRAFADTASSTLLPYLTDLRSRFATT